MTSQYVVVLKKKKNRFSCIRAASAAHLDCEGKTILKDNQMESEMVEEFIPIVMFIVTGVVFWLYFLFRHRTRAEKQQTIRMALEKGVDLSPELMKSLGEQEAPRSRDLRRGLIWLGLAAGLALCGVAVSFYSLEALYGCLAGAAFPFCIGIAYIIMWRYGATAQAT
jgi:uncharacterized membrane protein YoaK (UPF0700 family)